MGSFRQQISQQDQENILTTLREDELCGNINPSYNIKCKVISINSSIESIPIVICATLDNIMEG